MRSNTIEIEILPADEDWANTQLKKAIDSLSRGAKTAGHFIDTQLEKETVAAARVLRFLETRDAALAMVRFFDSGPYAAQSDIAAGLYGSPCRDEIISQLEEGLKSPEIPVTQNWMETLAQLSTARDFGPPPRLDQDRARSEAWNIHFMAIKERYMTMLSGDVKGKTGQARVVSLDILSRWNGPKATSSDSLAAIVDNFKDLPDDTKNRYLTTDWHRIASPAIEPLILSLAKGTGEARDSALMRLHEMNPAAARPIILDRIRNGDIPQGIYHDSQMLLVLPDRVLPEMDQSLIEKLEQGKDVGILISRYASNAIWGRIQAWVEANPSRVCSTVLPYLFRENPAYASDRLAKSSGCSLPRLLGMDYFMSPDLEKAAIADLKENHGQSFSQNLKFRIWMSTRFLLPQGHDAWVVGNEPVVLIDWSGASNYVLK